MGRARSTTHLLSIFSRRHSFVRTRLASGSKFSSYAPDRLLEGFMGDLEKQKVFFLIKEHKIKIGVFKNKKQTGPPNYAHLNCDCGVDSFGIVCCHVYDNVMNRPLPPCRRWKAGWHGKTAGHKKKHLFPAPPNKENFKQKIMDKIKEMTYKR
jgi:hypothetical protein